MTGILDHDPSNAALAKGPAEKADALSRPARKYVGQTLVKRSLSSRPARAQYVET
jgi:hypothetical protein